MWSEGSRVQTPELPCVTVSLSLFVSGGVWWANKSNPEMFKKFNYEKGFKKARTTPFYPVWLYFGAAFPIRKVVRPVLTATLAVTPHSCRRGRKNSHGSGMEQERAIPFSRQLKYISKGKAALAQFAAWNAHQGHFFCYFVRLVSILFRRR